MFLWETNQKQSEENETIGGHDRSTNRQPGAVFEVGLGENALPLRCGEH